MFNNNVLTLTMALNQTWKQNKKASWIQVWNLPKGWELHSHTPKWKACGDTMEAFVELPT